MTQFKKTITRLKQTQAHLEENLNVEIKRMAGYDLASEQSELNIENIKEEILEVKDAIGVFMTLDVNNV